MSVFFSPSSASLRFNPGFLDRQLDDARIDPIARDQQFANRDRQLESARARAPGIDEQHAIPRFYDRLVRMSGHHDAKSRRRRVDVELRPVVADVDRYLSELDHLVLGQHFRPRSLVVISTDGGDGRDAAQVFKNVGLNDIAGVNDVPATAERLQRFVSDQSVGVRDESDPDEFRRDH
jgi:hypothetical protein